MWEMLIRSCSMYVALSGLHVQVPALLAGKRGSHPPHRESKFPFVRVGYPRFANMAYKLAIITSLAPNLDQLNQSTLNLCSKFVLWFKTILCTQKLCPFSSISSIHYSILVPNTNTSNETWIVPIPMTLRAPVFLYHTGQLATIVESW